MKKQIIAALILLCCLGVPASAAVKLQDSGVSQGPMNDRQKKLLEFYQMYPAQMQLLNANLEKAEVALKAAEAQVIALALPMPGGDAARLDRERKEAAGALERCRREVLLLRAELDKTDKDKENLEYQIDLAFLPPASFAAGEFQAQGEALLQEVYINPTLGEETSAYGWRIHPVTGARRMHKGIDLANDEGTPVQAAKSAVVKFAGYNSISGNHIILRHYDGQETVYMHLYKRMVRQGQVVSQGDTIGLMGTTGRSTGSHLHYEMRINGTAVDPAPYLYHGSRRENR